MADTYYAKWAKLGEWPLNEALQFIVDYNISFESPEELQARLDAMDDYSFFYSDTHMDRDNQFHLAVRRFQYDLKHTPEDILKMFTSGVEITNLIWDDYSLPNYLVKPVEFLKWVITNANLNIPDEFRMQVVDYIDLDKVDNTKIDEEFERKFPKYNTLDINNPDKKELQELKQKYGILRDEAYKWKIAIPIAVKIGWLYFERGLNKQSSKKDFIKFYNQEFAHILDNERLAKWLYDCLPERATKASGSPSKVDADIEPVIKAAVYAGTQYEDRDGVTESSLKRDIKDDLENLGPLPDDAVLKRIVQILKKMDI